MLAAMSWLAGEEGKIKLPIGKDAYMEVPNYPLIFKSPVSYVEPQKDAPRVEDNYEEDAEQDAEPQGPVDE